MTNDDLKKIDTLLGKRFKDQDKKFDDRFKAQDKKFEALFDERFQAQDKKFEALLDKKFTAQKEDIIDEMIDFMNENLFPYLDKLAHKSDIERIERRLDAMSNQVGDHEVRIKYIESIPVVAHELKRRKKK